LFGNVLGVDCFWLTILLQSRYNVTEKTFMKVIKVETPSTFSLSMFLIPKVCEYPILIHQLQGFRKLFPYAYLSQHGCKISSDAS